jgi:hypothetical protein
MNYAELTVAIADYTENTFTATELAIFVEQAEQRIYSMVQLANLRKNQTGTITSGNKYLSAPNDYLSTYSLAVYTYATPTATGISAAFTIIVSSATDIAVGQIVTGSGIGAGAQVTVINGTTITLSVANSSTVSGAMVFQGDYLYLLNRDVNFIREVYPNPASTDEPKYYAIFGPQSNDVNELSFILGPTPDQTYKVELHYYYYPESIVTAGTTWLGENFDSALLYGSLVEAYTFMKGEQDMVQLYQTLYVQAIGLLKNLGDGKLRQDAYRSGQFREKVG